MSDDKNETVRADKFDLLQAIDILKFVSETLKGETGIEERTLRLSVIKELRSFSSDVLARFFVGVRRPGELEKVQIEAAKASVPQYTPGDLPKPPAKVAQGEAKTEFKAGDIIFKAPAGRDVVLKAPEPAQQPSNIATWKEPPVAPRGHTFSGVMEPGDPLPYLPAGYLSARQICGEQEFHNFRPSSSQSASCVNKVARYYRSMGLEIVISPNKQPHWDYVPIRDDGHRYVFGDELGGVTLSVAVWARGRRNGSVNGLNFYAPAVAYLIRNELRVLRDAELAESKAAFDDKRSKDQEVAAWAALSDEEKKAKLAATLAAKEEIIAKRRERKNEMDRARRLRIKEAKTPKMIERVVSVGVEGGA